MKKDDRGGALPASQDRAGAPDGTEPATQSQAKPLIPSAWQPFETVPRDGTPFVVGIHLSFDPETGELLALYRQYVCGVDVGLSWEPFQAPAAGFSSWALPSPFTRADVAQAIEARRAETQSGSVHESAVAVGHAPVSHPDTPNPGDTHD